MLRWVAEDAQDEQKTGRDWEGRGKISNKSSPVCVN